jgi:hypothetical protein
MRECRISIAGRMVSDDPDAGKKYAADVAETIQFGTSGKLPHSSPNRSKGWAVPLYFPIVI